MKFLGKKLLGLSLLGTLPLLLFAVMLVIYSFDMITSLLVSLVFVLLLVLVVHFFIITHPFLKIVESNSLPVLTIDSNGVIRVFLARVKPPEISFFDGVQHVKQLVSRFSTFYLTAPRGATMTRKEDSFFVEDDAGNKVAAFKQEEALTNRFDFLSVPCFLYNVHLGSLLTKDFLSQQEKYLFAEHNALYITRKVEEISQNAKLNADYAIALLGRSRLQVPEWVKWIAIVFLLAILGYLAYPHIVNMLSGSGKAVAEVASSAAPVVAPLTPPPIPS